MAAAIVFLSRTGLSDSTCIVCCSQIAKICWKTPVRMRGDRFGMALAVLPEITTAFVRRLAAPRLIAGW